MQRERFFRPVACSWEKLVASGRRPIASAWSYEEELELFLDLSTWGHCSDKEIVLLEQGKDGAVVATGDEHGLCETGTPPAALWRMLSPCLWMHPLHDQGGWRKQQQLPSRWWSCAGKAASAHDLDAEAKRSHLPKGWMGGRREHRRSCLQRGLRGSRRQGRSKWDTTGRMDLQEQEQAEQLWPARGLQGLHVCSPGDRVAGVMAWADHPWQEMGAGWGGVRPLQVRLDARSAGQAQGAAPVRRRRWPPCLAVAGAGLVGRPVHGDAAGGWRSCGIVLINAPDLLLLLLMMLMIPERQRTWTSRRQSFRCWVVMVQAFSHLQKGLQTCSHATI